MHAQDNKVTKVAAELSTETTRVASELRMETAQVADKLHAETAHIAENLATKHSEELTKVFDRMNAISAELHDWLFKILIAAITIAAAALGTALTYILSHIK
jgi:hypothetical protein